MHNTSERFRPAGHKAQELSEIVLPDEVFKPIQRVVKRPRFLERLFGREEQTVGYLYRDVEYTPGIVEDIVLSKELLYYPFGPILSSRHDWQKYELSEAENPLCWFVPSAPVILELCYRAQHEDTAVSREAQQSWHDTFKSRAWGSLTSTLLDYDKGNARIYHNWTIDAGAAPVPEEILFERSQDNTPAVNTFLQAMLGKRYSAAEGTFSKYKTPVRVYTPEKDVTGTRVLVLGVGIINNKFCIEASHDSYDHGYARGITLAKKLLVDKRYEVHDA